MKPAETLFIEIDNQGIDCVESHNLPKRYKGLLCKESNQDIIFIDQGIETKAELTCILCEELGHYYTSNGDITDQRKLNNQKQEKRARKWAHSRLIPLEKFVECYYHGCQDRFATAEYLEVTEEFLEEALSHYKEIYGQLAVIGDHVIYFDPLGVMQKFKNNAYDD